MRLAILLLLTLAASTASAQTAPYQWVGATTGAFTGTAGFVTLTTACRADYGPGARMCKSEEIMDSDTLNALAIPAEGCWVRPSWRLKYDYGTVVDESGVEGAPRHLTCWGWSSEGSAALALQSDGSFKALSCRVDARPVACCKPTPVPEPSASLSLPLGLLALSMMKGGA